MKLDPRAETRPGRWVRGQASKKRPRSPRAVDVVKATAAIADELAAKLEELRVLGLRRGQVDGLRVLLEGPLDRLALALQGVPGLPGLVEECLTDPRYCPSPKLVLEIPPPCRHGVVRGRAPDGSLAGCLSCDRASR